MHRFFPQRRARFRIFKDFISVPPLAQWPAVSKFSKKESGFLTLQVIWVMHLQLVTHCFLTPKPPSSHYRPGVYASGTHCFLTHLQSLPCRIQGKSYTTLSAPTSVLPGLGPRAPPRCPSQYIGCPFGATHTEPGSLGAHPAGSFRQSDLATIQFARRPPKVQWCPIYLGGKQ